MKPADPDCEFCGGLGTVRYPVWDDDSHRYQPVGDRTCVCRLDIKTEPEDIIENEL